MKEILTPPKTIAVIGLSDKPERYSYQVSEYLIANGFTVIPVNPMIESVFGLKSYASISEIPKDIKIDIVDIFRKSEFVVDIVKEVISLGIKPVIWMQEEVISPEGKELAESEGMFVVMDECTMKVHSSLIGA